MLWPWSYVSSAPSFECSVPYDGAHHAVSLTVRCCLWTCRDAAIQDLQKQLKLAREAREFAQSYRGVAEAVSTVAADAVDEFLALHRSKVPSESQAARRVAYNEDFPSCMDPLMDILFRLQKFDRPATAS